MFPGTFELTFLRAPVNNLENVNSYKERIGLLFNEKNSIQICLFLFGTCFIIHNSTHII